MNKYILSQHSKQPAIEEHTPKISFFPLFFFAHAMKPPMINNSYGINR